MHELFGNYNIQEVVSIVYINSKCTPRKVYPWVYVTPTTTTTTTTTAAAAATTSAAAEH